MQVIKINFKEKERHFIGVKESYGCNGCIAKNDNDLCSVLSNNHCSRDELVFQEIELEIKDKVYTLDQIKQAWKINWGNSQEPEDGFIKALKMLSDPEYHEYKRLQSKFEV